MTNWTKKNYFNSSGMIPMEDYALPFNATEDQKTFHNACEENDIKQVLFLINNIMIEKGDLGREVAMTIRTKKTELLKILIQYGTDIPYRATMYAVWTQN